MLFAAEDLHQARLEVDAEPFPPQHEEAGARRRPIGAQARTESARGEEDRDERRFEEHAVRLIRREILRRGDEGQKADPGHRDADSRPQIENECDGCRESEPHQRVERPIAGVDPQERRGEPVTLKSKRVMHGLEKGVGGKDAVRADQTVDLKIERVKRGEEDAAEGAQPDPAGAQIRRLAEIGRKPSLQQWRLRRRNVIEHGLETPRS